MKSIELAKTLQQTFADREAISHKGDAGIDKFEHGDRHAYVVRDLPLSHQIQLSKSFSSLNYFADGVERFEQSGNPVEQMKGFYDHGLLFREDHLHRADKRMYGKLLVEQSLELERMQPRIEEFFCKRKESIASAHVFSELFTRLCLGLVIANLVSVPLITSMRALRQRTNVFYYYFHPIRQQRTDRALVALYQSVADGNCDRLRWSLAQSLVVMGYDPIIGSLCAALLDDGCKDFATAPAKYCPVSFVARICEADISIDGYDFNAGDICYLSLVPASIAADNGGRSTFPFGAGVHACIGKAFSITALKIAEAVVRRCFPDGFDQPLKARGDGAFLVFEVDNAVQG